MKAIVFVSLFLSFPSLATGCKVQVESKKANPSPTVSSTPSELSAWDGRSDRSAPNWALQSLR